MHWDASIKEYSDFLTGCDNIEFVGSGNTLRESNLLWMRNIGGISFIRLFLRGLGFLALCA